ncbi:hypothetical protein [Algoriphagus machipongonensis]|uniref:Uncharacterized protein n=1 Tax=Algoriphagus machipongonensis TaxID=388413 RepID=A3HY23_9BACT|nr:hypothetical protein [Algoriphagus machipongonensis]EAZ81496.1 hypothetical protein ALPR1_20708 [Algoriphagus machipongonensis]
MFDGASFPKALDEQTFESWLENGRHSRIPFNFLLILWDDIEGEYEPVYVSEREEIHKYDRYTNTPGRQLLVAAYDLYSESRLV